MGVDVKNRRGKASRGRKITGIQHLPNDPSKLLITSNDSRIRLYNGESSLNKAMIARLDMKDRVFR